MPVPVRSTRVPWLTAAVSDLVVDAFALAVCCQGHGRPCRGAQWTGRTVRVSVRPDEPDGRWSTRGQSACCDRSSLALVRRADRSPPAPADGFALRNWSSPPFSCVWTTYWGRAGHPGMNADGWVGRVRTPRGAPWRAASRLSRVGRSEPASASPQRGGHGSAGRMEAGTGPASPREAYLACSGLIR